MWVRLRLYYHHTLLVWNHIFLGERYSGRLGIFEDKQFLNTSCH